MIEVSTGLTGYVEMDQKPWYLGHNNLFLNLIHITDSVGPTPVHETTQAFHSDFKSIRQWLKTV